MTKDKKHLKREKEKKLFDELNHLYMTEESEKDDVVYQYPLSWRSPGKEPADYL
jgi:hypothetical protein